MKFHRLEDRASRSKKGKDFKAKFQPAVSTIGPKQAYIQTLNLDKTEKQRLSCLQQLYDSHNL